MRFACSLRQSQFGRARSRMLIAVAAALLAGCQTTRLAERELPQLDVQDPPEVSCDAFRCSVEIEVLTYNVAALPWPIRRNRNQALSLIGDALEDARRAGTAPDIVFIQEGFRRSTGRLIERSGYSNWVRGPRADEVIEQYSARASDDFKKGRRFSKGEKFGKIMGSGLYILSDLPIVSKQTYAFPARECAGFDCGSNKGVLWAELQIPGMPQSVQLFTTHLQSREAAGVSFERSNEAYGLQIDALREFVAQHRDVDRPLIFGGDFNAKNADERFAYMLSTSDFSRDARQVQLIHDYCTNDDDNCGSFGKLDMKSPWLTTQDWQGFSDGSQIRVTPIVALDLEKVEFEGAPKIKGERTLSDHGALWVRYRLDWPRTD